MSSGYNGDWPSWPPKKGPLGRMYQGMDQKKAYLPTGSASHLYRDALRAASYIAADTAVATVFAKMRVVMGVASAEDTQALPELTKRLAETDANIRQCMGFIEPFTFVQDPELSLFVRGRRQI